MRGQSQERTLDWTLGHSKELEGLGQENPETGRPEQDGEKWVTGSQEQRSGAGDSGRDQKCPGPAEGLGAGSWADMGIP